MKLNRNEFESKVSFLWFIYNKLNCRNLTLCYSYKKKDGGLGFSRWVTYEELEYLELNENVKGTFDTKEQFLKKVSHRSVLDIEVMLDIDEKNNFDSIKDKAISICKKLKEMNIEYICSFTGSKSYHFSILFLELRNNKNWIKKKIEVLENLGADLQKASTRCMIALEGEKHYKSGKKKERVNLIE